MNWVWEYRKDTGKIRETSNNNLYADEQEQGKEGIQPLKDLFQSTLSLASLENLTLGKSFCHLKNTLLKMT